MPIRVTCPKCMARFNVSEKFAGREGPCPKCKTAIKIPEKSEEVIVHAPETSGPSDSKGRPVLKPIRRRETVLTPVQIALIAVTVVGFLIGSLLIGKYYPDPASMPFWLIPALLTGLAPACVLGAYTFLRDQESGSFVGRELLYRVLICAAIYAATWGAMPLGAYAFNGYGLGASLTATIFMLVVGSVAATLVLDLDRMISVVHYGLYFGCSMLLRLCAGLGVFPAAVPDGSNLPAPETLPNDNGLGNIIGSIDWSQATDMLWAAMR